MKNNLGENSDKNKIFIYSRSTSRNPGYNWKSLSKNEIDEPDKIYYEISQQYLINSEQKSLLVAVKDAKYILLITGISSKYLDITGRNFNSNFMIISNDEKLIRNLSIEYLKDTDIFEQKINNSLNLSDNSDFLINDDAEIILFLNNLKDQTINSEELDLIPHDQRYFSFFDQSNKLLIANLLLKYELPTKPFNELERNIPISPILIVTKDIELNKLISQGAYIVMTDFIDESYKKENKKKTIIIWLSILLLIFLILALKIIPI